MLLLCLWYAVCLRLTRMGNIWGVVGLARKAKRGQAWALVCVELSMLCAACWYGSAVLPHHSGMAAAVYCAFVALSCCLAALLWHVFVVRRPCWREKRATPARLVLALALAALFALFLEWGTLFGAPISNAWALEDWHASRVVAFFALSLPVTCLAVMFPWCASACCLWAALRVDGCRLAKRFLCWCAVVVVTGAVAWLAVGIACASAGKSSALPYQVAAVLLAALVVVLVGLRRLMADRPEWGLLAILTAAGIMLCVFTPLYTHVSWDDHIHYDRAVAVSYLIDPEYTPGDAVLIGRAYNDVAWFARASEGEGWIDPFEAQRLRQHYDRIDELGAEEQDAVRLNGAVTLRGVGIVEYYTVAYIPAAVGLWVARLLALSTTQAFLLGRLMTFVCYALVVFFACARLKSGKMILATCALVPTAVFLACGYSYDFWLIGFLMLGFSVFIGELQRPEEPLRWRWFLLMIVAFLVGLGPKAVYVPIAAMLLFMPRSKFVGLPAEPEGADCGVPALTHRRYLLVVFASALFVLATFVLPFFVAGPGEGDARGGAVDPAAQVSFILTDPLGYAGVFWNFLKDYLALQNAEFALTDFCGLETAHIERMVAALLLAVAITDRRACDVCYATHVKRIVMALLALLTVFLIATALFISFTPGGADYISGVQGRYLLPILFPFFVFCCNFRPFGRWGDGANRTIYHYGVLILSGAMLFYSIGDVLMLRF